MTNELIPRPTATRLAGAYKKAMNDIEQAFKKIEESKKTLKNAYGDTTSFSPFKFNQWEFKKIKKEITRSCWKRIVNMLEIQTFMTGKRLDKLQDEIDSDKTPEITEQSVIDFCNNIYMELKNLVNELIDEAYNWLHPHRNQFKTNKKFEIGERAIKNDVIEIFLGGAYISVYSEEKIQTLDNVFHLLNGKGAAKYPGNALTIIRQAIQDKKWQCETEYFNFKWYKKGTLHIQFKRLDLLKEFNKRAGKNRLKSQNYEEKY